MSQLRRGGRIIIPGEAEGRGGMQSRLFVPGQYADQDPGPIVGKCLVPGCDLKFYRGEEEAWQRHVGQHARQQIDTIRELSLRSRMPVMDENSWDPEIAEHMRKVGERMKKEGRLTVHKHERAGF